MREEVYLLMEETGCDEGQAELVLESCGNSLEKAIKIIYTLLRYIVVVKGKFLCPQVNLYGLFIIIGHKKDRLIMRQSAIVSCDPSVYEKELSTKWHVFEKDLYMLRLCEGSIQELSHRLEQSMNFSLLEEYHHVFFSALKDAPEEELKNLVKDILEKALNKPVDLVHMEVDELSMDQFRGLKDESSIPEIPLWSDRRKKGEQIILETELVEDGSRKGISIEHLKRDDVVLTKITDPRDIAYYLSHLMGGREGDKIVPISSVVQGIRNDDNCWTVTTRFSPGILGESRFQERTKVVVLRSPNRKSRLIHILVFTAFVLAAAGLLLYLF